MRTEVEAQSGKYWLRLTLQLVSLAVFGFFLWQGGADVWRHILSGDLQDVLMAFALLGMAGMLAATRLRLLSRAVTGHNLASWRSFYHLNMTTRAVGLVVPRSLSTFAGKPVALRALGMSIKYAIWTVLLDNALDLLLLCTWVIPGLLLLQNRISIRETIALTIGLTLLLAVAVWWATAANRFSSLVDRLKPLQRIVAHPPTDLDSRQKMLPARPTAFQALGLAVLMNAILAVRYPYVARAVGLAHPWLVFLAGFPITQLSLVVAVTPGGLGILDASWYGVLVMGGVSQKEAMTFVIAQRAYISVFVLIWAGVSMLLSLTVKEHDSA
jgi:uncharacterized membrane protein YbhN (UPF0104 family)